LHVDPTRKTVDHTRASEFASRLRPGDLLVVNDAATLPASLPIKNRDAELRLAAHAGDGYRAVLFGPGDYRTPTERRPPPPAVTVGQKLELGERRMDRDIGPSLFATVTQVDPRSPRLIEIRFSLDGAPLLQALYRIGRPIQYAYVNEPLELWDVQNRFAARPWAFEPPSAGRLLDGAELGALERRGVRWASLTHAAGISSTGSEVDELLPLPERFEIPERTIADIVAARARGGRIIAMGTTVVRALESSARDHGELRAGADVARLVVGPGFRPRIVDALVTGMHEPGSSHDSLLGAFAERELLDRAFAAAARAGYRGHEFGDFCLVAERA
jgi:S-adenosylmethionine:tRNA ribosyltransferase-isomerase